MNWRTIWERVTLPADEFRKKYAPTPNDLIEFGHALGDVHGEMQRQINKWGQQNHPSYTAWDVLGKDTPLSADMAKTICDAKARAGLVSWTDIFLEEVFEAIEEAKAGDLEKLRTELIQCAAVAVSWAESIDRNGK